MVFSVLAFWMARLTWARTFGILLIRMFSIKCFVKRIDLSNGESQMEESQIEESQMKELHWEALIDHPRWVSIEYAQRVCHSLGTFRNSQSAHTSARQYARPKCRTASSYLASRLPHLLRTRSPSIVRTSSAAISELLISHIKSGQFWIISKGFTIWTPG